MSNPFIDKADLKEALKEALTEVFQEHKELLHEAISEVLEDFARREEAKESQQSDHAFGEGAFRILEGRA